MKAFTEMQKPAQEAMKLFTEMQKPAIYGIVAKGGAVLCSFADLPLVH